jgi:carboxypeptidase-like protein
MSRLSVVLFVACLSAPGGVAQSPRARLEGTVLSVSNGLPVSGVIVSVPAANRLVATNDSGAFALDNLPPGDAGVVVAVLGHSSSAYTFSLAAGKTKRIEVLVDPGAVELDPIVVRASHLENRWGMSGFYARRRLGFGYFVTREEIDKRHYTNVRQMLSAFGVFYSCGRFGCGPTTMSQGRRCRMMVYVDGVPAFGEDIATLPGSDVAGVEVYKNTFDIPLQFNAALFSGASIGPCGAVAVWTRDWRSDLPEDW